MEVRKIKKQKRRVALLLHRWYPAYGGEQVYVENLARGLVEAGYEVDILTSDSDGRLSKDEKSFEKIPEIRVKRFRGPYVLSAFFELLKCRQKYYASHAHSVPAAFAMKSASWLTRVPTVLTVHSSHIFAEKWTLKKVLHRVMTLETKYGQEISISEQFLKGKNVNDPVLVIPPGIDVEPYDEVKGERVAEAFSVLFVGDLRYDKGIDLLLKAAAKLVESSEFIQRKKDFVLHIVGEGSEEKSLKKLAEKLDLSKYVKFHGRLLDEALIKQYKSADLFVMPSRADSLALTLLEACAASLPILATDVGDHRKIVLDNTNGHTVHPGDVDELSYYLEHFALNPHLEQMGEASYSLVSQEYDWAQCLEKNLRVYESFASAVAPGEHFMPWELPRLFSGRRKFKSEYKGRKPLKFCFTLDVENSHEPELLPDFLERFSDFSSTQEMPSSIFVETELLDGLRDEFLGLSSGGHELALRSSEASWNATPERKKVLRDLKDYSKAGGWKNLKMFRPPFAASEEDLEIIHAAGFEYLPVSEDPMPHLKWKFIFPVGEAIEMNLANFLKMDDEELLNSINRLRAYQSEHGVDPFLIFKANSNDFISTPGIEHSSGENFSILSQKLAFLREHMDIEFHTLSKFCKTL
ncbi:glycosyltransferase family 4 protein [Candidatus Peregrinibacteria bacterium]|jgi:glycosyltransferase involved in cell wall biosynthesis|nr:glycosyltransferase family 4 protein [Candidatus Peregrinibacteria bacterium]